ncbi:MAG: hypothetical protein F6K62_03000 [Sphaerospermopsis sp. SIO1G2]|nr:hypothetical protein [Sphaerospermopsis sp. SIO1G2]
MKIIEISKNQNFPSLNYDWVLIKSDTALSGVMRYTIGGQDAHPTRVL